MPPRRCTPSSPCNDFPASPVVDPAAGNLAPSWTSPSSGPSPLADAGADAVSNAGSSCTPWGGVAVAAKTSDSLLTSVSEVTFSLKLWNSSLAAVPLADLTVRYWFTADGNDVTRLAAVSDFSENGFATINPDVSFAFASAPTATPTADSFLEISFSSEAGVLAALDEAELMVQARFHGPGPSQYSDTFDETNDYSFDPARSPGAAFITAPTITAYIRGSLVWGCEP
ncbi:MAG: hypothetical protein JOZ69_15810 [Myxococcales bacterium]|nr:hypothetical protein [Myxococcales bacterium]